MVHSTTLTCIRTAQFTAFVPDGEAKAVENRSPIYLWHQNHTNFDLRGRFVSKSVENSADVVLLFIGLKARQIAILWKLSARN